MWNCLKIYHLDCYEYKSFATLYCINSSELNRPCSSPLAVQESQLSGVQLHVGTLHASVVPLQVQLGQLRH